MDADGDECPELAEVPVCEPSCHSETNCHHNLLGQLISPTGTGGRSREKMEGAIQWFGVDIGGTLVKCVYFETQEEGQVSSSGGSKNDRTNEIIGSAEMETRSSVSQCVASMRKFLKSNLTYGSSGVRDERLEMNSVCISGQVGTLHFIKFATSRMDGFFDMVTKNGLAMFPKVVCATGGGAFKFEADFKERLGIELRKCDEMESLTRGLHYLCTAYSNECYYWENPKTDHATKVTFDLGPTPYPCIIVNIGSGVSILLVRSDQDVKRIGGTSVGGGSFLGLCALLAGTSSFDEAISLAEQGNSTKVDKLVRDIYGGDYEKFGLPGDLVASSFGLMNMQERREEASKADLAQATLVTVTNNISAIARMCASISGVERVLFVGNYLCGNELSMQMLAYGMDYWSQGTIKALFLEHEGYFGALGCMLDKLENTS